MTVLCAQATAAGPVGGETWIALAWLAGILVVADVLAIGSYRRSIG